MEEWKKQALEAQFPELPLVQYAWVEIGDIEFSENVRHICRTECPRYGTSWSCPPAVGSVEECRARCESYSGAFVFTTIAEVHDTENMEETLATRAGHEAVTKQIRRMFEQSAGKAECGTAELSAIQGEIPMRVSQGRHRCELPVIQGDIPAEADCVDGDCRRQTAMCAAADMGSSDLISHSTLALSAESCALCRQCAYPDAPCRHPEQMLPCIESYGIVVPKLAEHAGIEFMNGAGIVTWFGMVLYR